MALMFGHANALCIGVFISIIYIAVSYTHLTLPTT